MTDITRIVSTGQLRVQSISIMISSRTRCNAGCKYCISRVTPGEEQESKVKLLDFNRLEAGLDFAARGGAFSAIITGKADPTQENDSYLCEVIEKCRRKIPTVDMHTNGFLLIKKPERLPQLVAAGLTMVTYSIASFNLSTNRKLMYIDQDPRLLIGSSRNLGLLVRCSLVINKQGVKDLDGVLDYISRAKQYGAHQLVVRELWLPDVEVPLNQEVARWNEENKVSIKDIEEAFSKEDVQKQANIKYIRDLPWGTPIFDVDGMNVTFARCEESYNGGTLKSLVHKIDGHGYMDWDHEGSILY